MAFKPRIACVAVRFAVLHKSESREATYLVDEVLAVILSQALGPDDSVAGYQLDSEDKKRIAYRSVSMSSCWSANCLLRSTLAYLDEIHLGELSVGRRHNDIENGNDVLVSTLSVLTPLPEISLAYLKCRKSLISLNVL